MNSTTKYTVLLISSVVVVYTIIGGMMGRVSAQDGSYPQLAIFMEVINRIQNDYVDEPSLVEVMNGAISGMVERVDPYGGYLSPEGVSFYREFDPLTSPGIGVTLSKKFDYPIIVATVPGGPADRAGLGSGDTIEGIEGESLREHNLIEVQQLLAGDVDTEVELTVIRRSRPAPQVMTLTRKVVAVPPVDARMLERNIGYLKIALLAPGKADEARTEIEALSEAGATSIVLDLRNSAGGAREEAVALANLFVESGTLGYLEGQTVERETFSAEPGNTVSELPLAVLINGGTADAAEIVAGAIRDNDRGELVGVRTFGMGSVQELLPLENGFALLLSVARYYAPDGAEIQSEGITPTVQVAATAPVDPLAGPGEDGPRPAPTDGSGTDRQLDRAIEILLEDTAAGAVAA